MMHIKFDFIKDLFFSEKLSDTLNKGYFAVRENFKERIVWHSNGQLSTHICYDNGIFDGECIQYYTDGTIFERCFYKKGKIEGRYELFIKSSNHRIVKYYKEGKAINDTEN